jgi:antirestriction protein
MTHEDQPAGLPDDGSPEQQAGGIPSPWDPDERVGDIYEVEIPDQPEQQENQQDDHPRIWVGSLSDYNNGILYGDWIEAARSPDDIHSDIRAMLDASPRAARTGEPAEEWGIFDHENFGNCRIDQYENLSWVSAVAKGIAEHGLAFAAWADVMEDEERLAGFVDVFLGHFDSVEAYVEQLIDDLGYAELLDQAMPDSIRRYTQIDTAALARDMEISGDVMAVTAEGGGVWLFDGR